MKRLAAFVLVALPLFFGVTSGQTAKPKTDAQPERD